MKQEETEKLEEFKANVEEHLNSYMDINDNIIKEFNDDIKEGFGFDLDLGAIGKFRIDIPIEDGINDKFIKPLNVIIGKSVSFFVGLINEIIGGIETTIKGLFDVLKKIVAFFNDTAARFIEMGKGLKDIFHGLFVTETDALGQGLKMGFDNIGVLLKWTGEFIFSYITCGVQYIQNLHRCIFFYVFDAVMHIAYFPIRLILWMVSLLTRSEDVYKLEQKIWDKIYEGDEIVYQYLGFHYIKYPKNIRDLCYNCKRMRVSALKNKVEEINYDFSTEMPQLLQKGINEMRGGSDKFSGAFSPNFKKPRDYSNVIDDKALSAPNIKKLNFSADNVIPKIKI